MNFDVDKFRAQFPFFAQSLSSHSVSDRETLSESLIYLDNAATTQKPQCVLDAQQTHLVQSNANVHRSAYPLAVRATQAYEHARETLAHFIGAQSDEIVFTRGATEGLNLLVAGIAESLNTGDVILISEQEHHANIVPWQFVAQKTGAVIEPVRVQSNGEIVQSELSHQLRNPKVKVLALTHVSNVLGIENPIAKICAEANKQNVISIIDGAQAVAHRSVDVKVLACDAYVFSGHKMFAPDGIGAVYIQKQLIEKLPPYHGGGEMIEHVSLQHSTFKSAPYKFEAGTPNVSGAVAFAQAAKFLKETAYAFKTHINTMADYILSELKALPLTCLNRGQNGIISFVPINDSMDAYDIAQILGEHGICVRAGQHCAEPFLEALGYHSCIRLSLAPYNTLQECKRFIEQLSQAIDLLR